MGDPPKSPTADFYNTLGITKGASLKEMCKAYKSLVHKWHPDKHHSNKAEAEAKFQQINEAFKALNQSKAEETLQGRNDNEPTTPTFDNHKSADDHFFLKPSALLKSLSKRSHTPTRSPSRRSTTPTPDVILSKSAYRRNPTLTRKNSNLKNNGESPIKRSTTPTPDTTRRSKSAYRRNPTPEREMPGVSRSISRRASPTPIVYTHSINARRKPPPIERKLECTLEDLCHGCVKHVRINRDVITNGIIEKEQEILQIIVKPGWKKGTKITFEGKGDERPGYLPADIAFLIEEKEHPLFSREGDDLLFGVQIPLLDALTGCTISVPLLGGENMSLTFTEVPYPGYEKVIRGQGMPKTNEGGRRGDLRIKFFVEFPKDLSDEQRSSVVDILRDCFS